MSTTYLKMSTPCIGDCRQVRGVCIGCRRTVKQIAEWTMMREEERLKIMKHLEIVKMSSGEKRARIAKACGWTDISSNYSHISGTIGRRFPDVPYFSSLPDYINDLNAIHEAEKVLTTTEQQNLYQSNIAEICYADHGRASNQVVFNQLTATAEQRANAFILTFCQ